MELFNRYICARERAYQLGKSDTMIGTPPDAVTMGSRMQSRQYYRRQTIPSCCYCKGNHWTDECMNYTTMEARKQRIKRSCFLCLKLGHIAIECAVNKICFHCGRRNHNHRSLCPSKFRLEQQVCAQRDENNSQQEIRENGVRADKNLESEEAMKPSTQNDETELRQQLRNLESLHKMTLQKLEQVKLDLKESKTEISRWKEDVSNIEAHQSNIQVINTEIDNIIQCQKQEIANLREETDKLKLVIRNLRNEIETMQISEPQVNKLRNNYKDEYKQTVVPLWKGNEKLETNTELSTENRKHLEDQTGNKILEMKVLDPAAELQLYEILQANFGQETETKSLSKILLMKLYQLVTCARSTGDFNLKNASNNPFAAHLKELRLMDQLINRHGLVLT